LEVLSWDESKTLTSVVFISSIHFRCPLSQLLGEKKLSRFVPKCQIPNRIFPRHPLWPRNFFKRAETSFNQLCRDFFDDKDFVKNSEGISEIFRLTMIIFSPPSEARLHVQIGFVKAVELVLGFSDHSFQEILSSHDQSNFCYDVWKRDTLPYVNYLEIVSK
jgi:hypothetical protein